MPLEIKLYFVKEGGRIIVGLFLILLVIWTHYQQIHQIEVENNKADKRLREAIDEVMSDGAEYKGGCSDCVITAENLAGGR